MDMAVQSLVPVLLALQFAAFGWRINREIQVGEEERKTWLPLPDYLNILSLLSVVAMCLVVPLATGEFGWVSKTVLAVAYILIGFHPINMAAHYRLFSKAGRSIYGKRDYPWLTDQEAVSIALSVMAAALGGWYVCTA